MPFNIQLPEHEYHRRRHGGGGQRGSLTPNLRSGTPEIDADPRRFRGRKKVGVLDCPQSHRYWSLTRVLMGGGGC